MSKRVVTVSQKVRLLLRLDLWAEVTTSEAESKFNTTESGAQFAMILGYPGRHRCMSGVVAWKCYGGRKIRGGRLGNGKDFQPIWLLKVII